MHRAGDDTSAGIAQRAEPLGGTGMQAPMYPCGGVRAYHGGAWPNPRALWGQNLYDDALLFERAPFLSPEGLRDTELIRAYATATGDLPGGLSVAAVSSHDFMHGLVVEPDLLRPAFRRVDTEARVAFVELVLQSIQRTPCNRPFPRTWDLETWAYWADGDQGYVSNLKRNFDTLRIQEKGPSESMMAWDRPLLPGI